MSETLQDFTTRTWIDSKLEGRSGYVELYLGNSTEVKREEEVSTGVENLWNPATTRAWNNPRESMAN